MQRSLPDLPAGLIAFLLNDCWYSAEVATRCVLELADKGVLRAEPGPGGALTINLAAASPLSGRTLQPLEEVTLDRIRSRTARQAKLPLSVLLSDDGEDYNVWRGRLTDALGREGKRTGLTTRAASKGVWYVQLVVTTVVGLITLGAYQISVKDGQNALALGGIAVLLSLLGILFAGDGAQHARGPRSLPCGGSRAASHHGSRLIRGWAVRPWCPRRQRLAPGRAAPRCPRPRCGRRSAGTGTLSSSGSRLGRPSGPLCAA